MKKTKSKNANSVKFPKQESQQFVNKLIEDFKTEHGGDFTDKISDGYHTFEELYDHRTKLFIALCRLLPSDIVWKAKKHYDGSMYAGMFIMGVNTQDGQATYHLEDKYWNDVEFVKELPKAPEFDGHTPSVAISRLVAEAWRVSDLNTIAQLCT